MAVRVEGAKEAIKTLRKIDPELRKEFNAEVRRIAAPIVDAAKANYTDTMIPSGTRRSWSQRGRKLFPFTVTKARQGVRAKPDTRARSRSVIKVVQSNPAAAVYEFAGDATDNKLGRAFTSKSRAPARVMWPVAETKVGAVTDEMEDLIKNVEKLVSKELR